MRVTVSVKHNTFGKIGSGVRQRASQVIRKTALDLEAHAKAVVPVDTGALKGSIQTNVESGLAATVDVGQEYGVYVEYGTARSPAQPYLTPAADAVRPGFEAAMRTVFGNG